MSLDYHWSLDFVGPLIVTPCEAKCMLVMEEHFSKWIELVPFLNYVLAHFRAPVDVLIDEWRKFLSSFKEVCTKALIDHHTTSRNHLETDGLVESIVQIVKCSLWKYGLLGGNHHDWDLMLPWIAMDYRFNSQT